MITFKDNIMGSSTTVNSNSGIGFIGILTIVFITLKVTNYVDWSWWWVLSPIWIDFILHLIFNRSPDQNHR